MTSGALFQIITLTGVFVSSIAAVAAAVFSWIDGRQIREVHLTLNSRLDTLLANAELVGKMKETARATAEEKDNRAGQPDTCLGLADGD
jgi:hypothetical protein